MDKDEQIQEVPACSVDIIGAKSDLATHGLRGLGLLKDKKRFTIIYVCQFCGRLINYCITPCIFCNNYPKTKKEAATSLILSNLNLGITHLLAISKAVKNKEDLELVISNFEQLIDEISKIESTNPLNFFRLMTDRAASNEAYAKYQTSEILMQNTRGAFQRRSDTVCQKSEGVLNEIEQRETGIWAFNVFLTFVENYLDIVGDHESMEELILISVFMITQLIEDNKLPERNLRNSWKELLSKANYFGSSELKGAVDIKEGLLFDSDVTKEQREIIMTFWMSIRVLLLRNEKEPMDATENLQKEIEVLRQAILINSNDAEAHYNLGAVYFTLGRYPEAIDAFKEGIRIKPDDAEAHFSLGSSYFPLGRYPEAIDAFKEAIRIKPDLADAHFRLGASYAPLHRYPEAIDAYKQAIRLKPDDANAHFCLGMTYSLLDRYPEAIDALKQAIRLKIDDVLVYYNLGAACFKLSRHEEAIDAFKEVIRLNPDYAEAYSHLGAIYSKLGRHQEAIDAYKQATRIKPDDVETQNNLEVVYANLSRYQRDQKEIDVLKQAIRLKPKDAEAHYNLGLAHDQWGRAQEAIDAYNQAIRINPDMAEAHRNMGDDYTDLGRYTEAIDSYKEAIRIKPDDAETHFTLGLTYSLSGNKLSALEQHKILKDLNSYFAEDLFNEIYK